MPAQLLIFLTLVLIFGSAPKEKNFECCYKKIAKCIGADPCKACSTCSSCQYCVAGKTCGVCKRKESKPKETSTGQCKAITKKGSRCSRTGTDKGYCWQHKKT